MSVNLQLLSLDLEVETGRDSIPTIERLYDGKCPWPDCGYRARNAEQMWKHLHFIENGHGLSFGVSFDDLVEQRRETIGMHQ
jgi:hypothetical protein